MKIKLKIEKEFDARYLLVDAEVRYWEDSKLNGVDDDSESPKMPCNDGLSWKPLIDLEESFITNWDMGNAAYLHYKVCDAGIYTLLDKDHKKITTYRGYVLDMLCPNGGGYGDYIIMDIDDTGYIKNFKPDFKEFIQEDDD